MYKRQAKLKSFFGADDRDHQIQGHAEHDHAHNHDHDHDHEHEHDHAHGHEHAEPAAPTVPATDPAGMPTGDARPHEGEDRPA